MSFGVVFKGVLSGINVYRYGMGFEFDVDFELEMTEEIVKDCNAFKLNCDKPLRLKVVSIERIMKEAEQKAAEKSLRYIPKPLPGCKYQEYEISAEYEPLYACHRGAGNPAAHVVERLIFATDNKQWMVTYDYRVAVSLTPDAWQAKCTYTLERLKEVRAEAGAFVNKYCMRMLNREREWDMKWKKRSSMVYRLLCWMFKEMSAEFRFDIFMEVRKGWCALSHV